MSPTHDEPVDPNKPFRFFRIFKRELGPNLTYPDFVSMPSEGLRELAFALLDDAVTGPIFRKAGIHGDIGGDEEPSISDLVERFVDEQGWDKPDPANLVISTVLARQLADGGIARDDKKAQIDFIEDKRCDGLGAYKHFSPRTPKTLKASEIFQVLRSFEESDNLILRFRLLRENSYYDRDDLFPNEDDKGSWYFYLSGAQFARIAVQKYALSNRNIDAFYSIASNVLLLYSRKKIDHIYDDSVIEYYSKINSGPRRERFLIDDR